MGLIKGTVTLSRYTVAGQAPEGFQDFLDQRIRQRLFRDIEDSAEEISVGWVSVHDFMDTRFSQASYALDPYVALAMRVDRRRVPAAVLKRHHRREMDKALGLRQGRGLTRAEREELKEKARLQLLARIPPSTQVIEAVWDAARGEALFFSAAKNARELFEDLFRATFGLHLVPRIPYLLAADLLGKGKAAQRLEAARPLSLYQAED